MEDKRLLDRVRDKIRVKNYSIRTEEAYLHWAKRYILFHGKRHPQELGAKEAEAFLTHLAVVDNVSASTQNQAKSALLFLYKDVLEMNLPWMTDIVSAKTPQRLPVVLTMSEVDDVLAQTEGTSGLIVKLLYGSGMRLLECLRLRIKDLDFERNEIVVRQAKGLKDRVTMLPDSLSDELRAHIAEVQYLHEADLCAGLGEVYMPYALNRKYPKAGKSWAWQYVFPAARISKDPRSMRFARHHADEQAIQRCMRDAVYQANVNKQATPHTLRHYVPFLTMSSSSQRDADLIGNDRSHRAKPGCVTRHSLATVTAC